MTNVSIGMLTLVIMFYGGKLVAQDELSPGKLMSYLVATQSVQRSFCRKNCLCKSAY